MQKSAGTHFAFAEYIAAAAFAKKSSGNERHYAKACASDKKF